MKFSVMIPQNYNDGSEVSGTVLEGLYRLFWSKFGGCTIDAASDGYWWGEAKHAAMKLYVDKVRRLTVYVESNSRANLDYARLITRKVGVVLNQECMYFEHDADWAVAVEMLKIDKNESFNAII